MLSLNELVSKICIDLGYGANFSGSIKFTFGQGGVRQPILSSKSKERLVPFIKAICEPLFQLKPLQGLVTLNIHSGKISGFPKFEEKTEGRTRLEADEYESYLFGSGAVWRALLKHPNEPLMPLVKNPIRYESIKRLASVELSRDVEIRKHVPHRY
jgi:hypothetical protein